MDLFIYFFTHEWRIKVFFFNCFSWNFDVNIAITWFLLRIQRPLNTNEDWELSDFKMADQKKTRHFTSVVNLQKLEFHGSLIINLMSNFVNSRWRIHYCLPPNLKQLLRQRNDILEVRGFSVDDLDRPPSGTSKIASFGFVTERPGKPRRKFRS